MLGAQTQPGAWLVSALGIARGVPRLPELSLAPLSEVSCAVALALHLFAALLDRARSLVFHRSAPFAACPIGPLSSKIPAWFADSSGHRPLGGRACLHATSDAFVL